MLQSFLGLFKRGLLFGRFLKNFPWSPLFTFSENDVLGDLGIIVITFPFGLFWSRLLRQNLLQSFHFNFILIRV